MLPRYLGEGLNLQGTTPNTKIVLSNVSSRGGSLSARVPGFLLPVLQKVGGVALDSAMDAGSRVVQAGFDRAATMLGGKRKRSGSPQYEEARYESDEDDLGDIVQAAEQGAAERNFDA